jgi:hypothetical protein
MPDLLKLLPAYIDNLRSKSERVQSVASNDQVEVARMATGLQRELISVQKPTDGEFIDNMLDTYYRRLDNFAAHWLLGSTQQFQFVQARQKQASSRHSLSEVEKKVWDKLLSDIATTMLALSRCLRLVRPNDESFVRAPVLMKRMILPDSDSLAGLSKTIYDIRAWVGHRYEQLVMESKCDKDLNCITTYDAMDDVVGCMVYRIRRDARDDQGNPDPHVLIEDFAAMGEKSNAVPAMLMQHPFENAYLLPSVLGGTACCERIALHKRIINTVTGN